MEWFEGLLVMAIAFLLVYRFAKLEMAFSAVRRSNIVRFEMEKGTSTASETLKALLSKDRMIVVYFIAFLAFGVTLGTPWVLRGILPRSDGGAFSNAVFVAYAIIFFTCGELVSKNRGYKHALKVALFAAPFVDLALKIFFPIAWVLRLVYRLSGGEHVVQAKEEDVIASAILAHEDGSLNSEEARLIARMIAAGNKRVGDLLVPLDTCIAIPLKLACQQLRDALDRAIAQSQLFICVVDGKTIVGFLERKDLTSFVMKPSLSPGDIIDLSTSGCVRSTVDLPPHKPISDVLGLLREHQCAVVNAEGRGTIGIITMQDVVKEILGP